MGKSWREPRPHRYRQNLDDTTAEKIIERLLMEEAREELKEVTAPQEASNAA